MSSFLARSGRECSIKCPSRPEPRWARWCRSDASATSTRSAIWARSSAAKRPHTSTERSSPWMADWRWACRHDLARRPARGRERASMVQTTDAKLAVRAGVGASPSSFLDGPPLAADRWEDLIFEERRDLLELALELTPAELAVPSLCMGWRVRDVIAHVVAYDE